MKSFFAQNEPLKKSKQQVLSNVPIPILATRTRSRRQSKANPNFLKVFSKVFLDLAVEEICMKTEVFLAFESLK
jgi:hypothetical protein